MSDLTEAEILACVRENAKSAAADCAMLAQLPARGPTYVRMRASLKLLEGACRQMAYWREDTRWLPISMQVEEAHKRCQKWLQFHYPRPMFLKLADNLRLIEAVAEGLATKATGRTGMILPVPLTPPHRETRPVQIITP